MDLSQSTVLVTGANRGIGRAVTNAFHRAGVKKIYAGSRGGDTPEGAGITPIRLDITDPATIDAAARTCSDVTLLVNNAGIVRGGGPLGAPSLEGLRAEMDTNVFGTLALTRAFAPIIRDNGGGGIVALASILALAPIPQIGTYAASKAALHSLMMSLRAELDGSGVAVVSVLPALVDTDMTAGIDQQKMTPEQIAAALITGLENDETEIFPGPAETMAQGYHANPTGYAAQLAAEFRREPAE
ncbi:SDR family NAD(P)-dependent oxidoreductase [Hwanghaeella grinnelliae]|uniref:SDR family NAD(P)-dependent oxidoreductase n=1 Tax=Hwanghaeella grinnelliae TaxID=2500179 RepID=A0A437QYL0_9PROT|nr:SDR family NAD(P)-dependent oxidoreductase [Hwanghaeella grinnelliae]RVU39581.1 SDR family NAD(P)-dependent oxidoreductase [Hwanghaeella grinnelliae]